MPEELLEYESMLDDEAEHAIMDKSQTTSTTTTSTTTPLPAAVSVPVVINLSYQAKANSKQLSPPGWGCCFEFWNFDKCSNGAACTYQHIPYTWDKNSAIEKWKLIMEREHPGLEQSAESVRKRPEEARVLDVDGGSLLPF